MYIVRMSYPTITTVFTIALLSTTVCVSQTSNAQERGNFDEGFDARMGVIFEDSAPSALNRASSPDGRLLAKSEYKKIRVYSVERNKLLHEFSTSGSTNSPLFTADGAKLIAAVCRGNLGCISTLYSWNLTTGARTRLGECSGMVLDICTDAKGKRLAVTTYYGPIFSQVLAKRESKWYGGEIVVFDKATPSASVRIFCELSGVPSLKQFASEAKDMGDDRDERIANMKKSLANANRSCLPVRVGLTPDGEKVIGVTSTGVVRVFDAGTGKPELVLSRRSRVGSEFFGSRQ